MPSLTAKQIDGHTYYYARYCQRIDGKPKAAEVQLAETHLQRQQGILSGGERVGSTGLRQKAMLTLAGA